MARHIMQCCAAFLQACARLQRAARLRLAACHAMLPLLTCLAQPCPRAEGSEGAPGSARTRAAVGLSAATAKRFKHEKTLVMLNPLLGGEPPGGGAARCR